MHGYIVGDVHLSPEADLKYLQPLIAQTILSSITIVIECSRSGG